MTLPWLLECWSCGATRDADGLATLCPCGQPWLVRQDIPPPPSLPDPASWSAATPGAGMWRYRPFLPIGPEELPVTLGEGDTPLRQAPRLAARLEIDDLWIKDEAANPTGSFKARGLSMAVTRAVAAGASNLVIPTAGNAGIAAAAYGRRAGTPVRVYAPADTPPGILREITAQGGELIISDGHIGDCGRAARAWAAETGAFDLSTLREPYRIEGKKTLGLEVVAQLGWRFPDAMVYPTGGGTGLIGMWKAFGELLRAGWVQGRPPRMYSVQAQGCAPVVRAFEAGADRTEPWDNPRTSASGLRVPHPLGDRLILRAIRQSGGAAIAVPDEELTEKARAGGALEGIDFSPEGGAALAAVPLLRSRGLLHRGERVVVCNTGSGLLYR